MEPIFIDSANDLLLIGSGDLIEQFTAPVADPEVFARHQNLPGHNQQALRNARVLLPGGGALGSWTALLLARSGLGHLTIADHDDVEWSNLSRQLFGPEDVGQSKAIALARRLAVEMVGGGVIEGIALPFQRLIAENMLPYPADVIACGVDNNACRLEVVRYARRHRIPAVHTSLSNDDGQRCVSFLQGPNPEDPCLWCANPNLDPEAVTPCNANSIITGACLGATFAAYFVHRALMGWPPGIEPFNWREADLLGQIPEVVGRVEKRPDCPVCGDL